MSWLLWAALFLAIGLVILVWSQAGEIESTTLKVGDLAPDFELESQAGQKIRLSDLLTRGHVVLYFYIQDATPG